MNEKFDKSTFPKVSKNLEHKETHLGVQLQTEELMMTSIQETFQGTSESERQALISAQQMAAGLQHEMSQATTACDSWKTKKKRLTKEVAEQNTKSIAG